MPTAPIKTNLLALVGFIASFMIPVVGIVLGALALGQIRQTRESGRGLARWAVGIGVVGAFFQLGFFIVWLSVFIPAFSNASFVR